MSLKHIKRDPDLATWSWILLRMPPPALSMVLIMSNKSLQRQSALVSSMNPKILSSWINLNTWLLLQCSIATIQISSFHFIISYPDTKKIWEEKISLRFTTAPVTETARIDRDANRHNVNYKIKTLLYWEYSPRTKSLYFIEFLFFSYEKPRIFQSFIPHTKQWRYHNNNKIPRNWFPLALIPNFNLKFHGQMQTGSHVWTDAQPRFFFIPY